MTISRLRRRSLLAASGAALLAAPAVAQGPWRPTKAVRVIVPAAPGGGTDILGRMLAAHLQEKWGQSVVVENKSGGGGTIGTMDVVRSPADGHTILMGNIGPQSIAYTLYRGLPYTPEQLTPVSNMLTGPNVLVVHPSVPAKTIPEFVAWLKKEDGKASYASSGTGQSPHVSGAWFLQLTGTKMTHVPYRGASPALTDLIAGVTNCFFDNLATSLKFIQGGQLRGIAVTSAQRSPYLPDMPAIRETMPELKDYDVSTWFGVFLPANAPKAIVEELNGQIKVLLDSEESKKRFVQMAGNNGWAPPAQYDAFVKNEIVKWRTVIEKEGLKLDIS